MPSNNSKKDVPNVSKKRRIILCAVLFVFGGLVGYRIHAFIHRLDGHFHLFDTPKLDFFESDDKFAHVSPLLFCADTAIVNLNNKEVATLNSEIKSYISNAEEQDNTLEVGVYYRDLSNGPWIGVNQDLLFKPGSLLKVPIAISAFKYAESHPDFLKTKVKYMLGDRNATQVYKPSKFAEDGKTYTVQELIDLILIYSDNNATAQLTSMIDKKFLEEIYDQLNIELVDVGTSLALTVRKYASFFRILYNSTYLSSEQSEQILATLLKSEFKNGLTAGIPPGTEVAHKFGERHLEGGTAQLHDCGIVYKDKDPYILCIMTRGKNTMQLATIIKDISSMVYQQVDKSGR